jgi:hypothetical protein
MAIECGAAAETHDRAALGHHPEKACPGLAPVVETGITKKIMPHQTPKAAIYSI